MNTRQVQIVLQIVALIIFYCLLFINYRTSLAGATTAQILWITSFDFTVLIGGVYICTCLLLPKLFARGRYFLFAVLYLLLVATSALAIVLDDGMAIATVEERAKETGNDIFVYFLSAAALVTLITLAGIGIRGVTNWLLSIGQLNRLREENLRTELAFLRSQLNPHFLFNTLNLIFGHIDKANTTARDMILRFAELMRYQLYECDVNHIDIEREIAYVQHYVELQKLRKNESLDCSLKLTGTLTGFSIPPLLLMPVVENAFKHLGTGENNFLHMEMIQNDRSFHFNCTNSKSDSATEEVIKSNGIGLANIRRRLELTYPDRHTLHILDEPGTFGVQLSISL